MMNLARPSVERVASGARGTDVGDNKTFVILVLAVIFAPVIIAVVSCVADAFIKAKALDLLVECVKNADHLDAEERADLKKALARFGVDKGKEKKED